MKTLLLSGVLFLLLLAMTPAVDAGCLSGDCVNGFGVILLDDGRKYEGHFKSGRQDGIGEMVFPAGDTYKGGWQDGAPSGRGVLRFKEGMVYDGEFIVGRRHGQGTLTMGNGTVYEGQWQDDMPNGQGRLTFPDGSSYSGGFLDGLRHGAATVIHPDGSSEKTFWQKGIQADRSAAPAAAAVNDSPLSEYASVSGDRVNIRSGPGKQEEILQSVALKTPLRILGRQDDWVEVQDFTGRTGWISANLLDGRQTVQVRVRRANLRQGPGSNFVVVGSSSYADILEVSGQDGEWYRVEGSDGASWINRELVWPFDY